MSLHDVRKLLDDRGLGEKAFEAVDQLIDAAVIFSPVLLGLGGFALHALLEPKDHLVALCKNVIKAICKSDAHDYLDQAENLAAAHCLLTYVAYFDVLNTRIPTLAKSLKLSAEEKRLIASSAFRSADGSGREFVAGVSVNSTPLDSAHPENDLISLPHPAMSEAASDIRMALYRRMSGIWLERFTSDDDRRDRLPADGWNRVLAELTENIPSLADRLYRAELVGLAIDFPQFLTWLTLTDQEAKDILIRKIGTDTRVQFELVGRTIDLGLRGLADEMSQLRRAMAELGEQVTDQPSDLGLAAVAEALHRGYVHQIDQPVINDRYEPARGPKLGYPTRAESYVPQAYRLATFTAKADDEATSHLERDDAWTGRALGDDLGQFVLRYLESAYSTQSPLLILGHPGSGKSLLTQILAARLAYPAYTTVRVELRGVDPKTDIQRQIEAQIRKDTGEDVSWARFTRTLPSPTVVILDGYDELLQATGSLYADFLDQVRLFQEREYVTQRRPVRVIVTSRITLINKVIVPDGTTIVRLEEFDEKRRDAWSEVWNARNSGYFAEAAVQPFRLPVGNPKISDLAAQPLLLLMLALYDSAANQLSSEPNIDQTRLYHELLTRFIRRELDKDATGFRQLPSEDQRARIDRELERLGVAAMGMFNRQSLTVSREDLNRDLHYFNAELDKPGAGNRPLSQADLLLGSFFFIYESRSGESGPGAPADRRTSLATFEFLHKTFGEFLTADFILRQVLTQAEEVSDLSSNPRRAATLQRHLELLDESWFGCLAHTPLHTQPNVLTLLKEWVGHRLAAEDRSQSDMLMALDKIILAQLRRLLTEPTLPILVSPDQAMPYDRLPALGHLAIYSLNLVVLRAYLANGPYVLDEASFGDQRTGCRPWDRLTAIWRSWFPTESLATLASLFTASREQTRITAVQAQSPLAVAAPTDLAVAYNVSLSLADNLTTASLGLHLTSLVSVHENYVEGLRDRVQADAADLIPFMEFLVARISQRPTADLPVFFNEYQMTFGQDASAFLETADGYLPRGHSIELAELQDRLLLSPASQAIHRKNDPDSMHLYLPPLSRYAAEVVVQSRVKFWANWLPRFLLQEDWPKGQEFLMSPAAAPILRAALRQLNPTECVTAVRSISRALGDDTNAIFDIDTAAGLALLAWRGKADELCIRILDSIIRSCREGIWQIFDIPEQLWGDLADLFMSANSEIEIRRYGFAELISENFNNIDEVTKTIGNFPSVEWVIHILRIGADLGRANRSYIYSGRNPKLFLLMIRMARERNDKVAVVDLLASGPGKSPGDVLEWRILFGVPSVETLEGLDIEKISIDLGLTYRETMDLRWAIDVAREVDHNRKPAPRRPRTRQPKNS